MSINPYINFEGQAKDAMAFYAKVLGTEEPSIMYFKDMPPNPDMPIPEEMGDWVMHGSINYKGQLIMFSDVVPGGPAKHTVGNNISILIDNDDYDELKALFEAFSDDATIEMPFETTFWAKGFGSLVDKFGVGWQFNCTGEEE